MDIINQSFGVFWYIAIALCFYAAHKCNDVYKRTCFYMLIGATLSVDVIYNLLMFSGGGVSVIVILKFKLFYFVVIAMMFVSLSLSYVLMSILFRRNGIAVTKNAISQHIKYCFIGSLVLLIAPIEAIFEYIYASKELFNITNGFIDFVYIWVNIDWMLIASTCYFLYCFVHFYSNRGNGNDRIRIYDAFFGNRSNRTSGDLLHSEKGGK